MTVLRLLLIACSAALFGAACTSVSELPGGALPIDGGLIDSAGDVVAPEPDTTDWDSMVVTPGGFLSPCEDNADCNSGWCVPSPEGEQCSKSCQDETSCPPGWGCSPVASTGRDTAYLCIPYDTDLCRPCVTDSECNQPGAPAVGHCMYLGDFGNLCSRVCDSELTCPEGFTCQPTQPKGPDGPTLDLCFPASSDSCTCTQRMVNVGASTTCYTDNDFGKCSATLSCEEVGPFPACPAPAAQPELCNGIDDDCDGQTDVDADDCTVFFEDADGDNWGLGDVGQCVCDPPGPNWVENGGDCNELMTSVNPGAVEVCNGMDDDCDGETDEIGAEGCVPSYRDGDGDGYGVDGEGAEVQCRCGDTEGWSPVAGDCDDDNAELNPGVQEACNLIDDDCDGQTDEPDAAGCKPYFIDSDGDTYGVTSLAKCLCGPTGSYTSNKPGDCDDTTEAISPGTPEICDDIDNNCDGQTDEGGGAMLCPDIANGAAECTDGSCALVSCDAGWTDADGDPLNGCECNAGQFEPPGSAGQACSEPEVLGTVMDSGQFVEVTDNIAPVGDEDWYQVTAIDGADTATGTSTACDTFNVQVYFLQNPGEQFVFDVYRKTVDEADACANQWCVEETQFSDFTDFKDIVLGEERGECPCTSEPENSVNKPAGVQICTDNTAEYRIRVYRKPGFPDACASYTLRIENGPQI